MAQSNNERSPRWAALRGCGTRCRHNEDWSLCVAQRARARLRRLDVRHHIAQLGEVLRGVGNGEAVVDRPSDALVDGGRNLDTLAPLTSFGFAR
jgi:hypothetical protein